MSDKVLMPSIFRRALSVWLKSQQNATPVIFRIPDESDSPPFYSISWYVDEQDHDKPWSRHEQMMINCVSPGADGAYGSALMKEAAINFFNRDFTISDINTFIDYMVANGEEIPYRLTSLYVYDDSNGAEPTDDGTSLSAVFYVKYCITYNQESIPRLQDIAPADLAIYDS